MKFLTNVCYFCNNKMQSLTRIKEIEYSCTNKFCNTKYYYQTWTDKNGALKLVMFLCDDRDVEINYEYNDTTILKRKESRQILFKFNYALEFTEEKDYNWLKNKISNYNVLI